MKIKIFVILLILLIALISIVLIFGGEKKPNIKNIFSGEIVSDESENEGNSPDSSSKINSGGGESNGGSDDGNVGNAQQNNRNSNCAETQISYGLTNLNVNSFCNSFSDGFCTDKTVICSLRVHNLDNSVAGVFSINFMYYPIDNPEETIENVAVSDFVDASSYKIFTSQINIQSEGENGDANREFYCAFSSLEIPKRTICN